ncbi:carbamoyl-phosphate synthase (glutamine-hydrolyzing) large subunit [Virgibacillus halodenitrificans]|uniref:carbamoyl-phosphate synthase (glutamine-hydrolyzing) large subunit n=1 Tax=Virgibacillus halodenitrificans TaxID=1482 RepID=UPI001FB240D1|nr:carbamoyl-phosphate synthase (glutamine-hydrolyzing) large subunit [Virgibacillus halodenitrificans]MCJ0932343.1 carbamoyl-phosphate synthase (glutamine-hydrolyzing) large subunit [Virgibacillus halodenitrificans]
MTKINQLKKVMVIGSGPIVIGQAAEFDYAGTQACIALKEEGIEVILVNNNPATMMTDKQIADHVYMEPLTIESLESIISIEKPDGLIGTLGGQTGLNLTVELHEQGILEKYQVKLLGSSVPSIQQGEDREKFRELMLEINEPVCESTIIQSVEEGKSFIQSTGYPVILRPAYTLGGEGGGFAENEDEYKELLENGLNLSPIDQVLVEKSIKGWKEIEFEVIRDAADNCVVVCDMENVDPVGVHTGDSIVVAPSQTITTEQKELLERASVKIIRALHVIGGCNIQFALHPETNAYYIIEVNPRVSRSSALASKATAYPIALVATKCAIGYTLDEIVNPVAGNAYASEAPVLDYVVVKAPRFPFDKFTEADRRLGTQMKATGEVMAIDRTFIGALNKAVRSLELHMNSLNWKEMSVLSKEDLMESIAVPNDLRLFAIAEALTRGIEVNEIQEITQINSWFIEEINKVITCEQKIERYSLSNVSSELLKEAKLLNISDERIAELLETTGKKVRSLYKSMDFHLSYHLMKTSQSSTQPIASCYYSSWGNDNEESAYETETEKILVLGSGPIRIGQGVEFDYCSVHAALAVKKMGYEAIVINNNPETVSTDYTIADRLYFEPLALEDVLAVIEKEKPAGVLIQFGGQTAVNLANSLQEEGVHIFGTAPKHIDQMEDREQFYEVLNKLNINHVPGFVVNEHENIATTVNELGFPVLIRPSYVIGGQSMFICNNEIELQAYVKRIQQDTKDRCWPLLIDSYIPGVECEIDVISDGQQIIVPAIIEHIERAGVHSGDSMNIFPAISLTDKMKERIINIARIISQQVPIIGMMNIQFVIDGDTIYVLEVNPRSSRTVPMLSKIMDIPMVEWGVRAQLGEALDDISSELNLANEPEYYMVKAPVFSAGKLKGVDHVLGPEMKSTGEAIGIGETKEVALANALPENVQKMFKSKKPLNVIVSISEREKPNCINLLKKLIVEGAVITATKGTTAYLEEMGIPVYNTVYTKEEIHGLWRSNTPDLVLNIPSQGRKKEKTGFYLRELAVRYQTPYFTSLDTLQVLYSWLRNAEQVIKPKSLQEYLHQLNKDKILHAGK